MIAGKMECGQQYFQLSWWLRSPKSKIDLNFISRSCPTFRNSMQWSPVSWPLNLRCNRSHSCKTASSIGKKMQWKKIKSPLKCLQLAASTRSHAAWSGNSWWTRRPPGVEPSWSSRTSVFLNAWIWGRLTEHQTRFFWVGFELARPKKGWDSFGHIPVYKNANNDYNDVFHTYLNPYFGDIRTSWKQFTSGMGIVPDLFPFICQVSVAFRTIPEYSKRKYFGRIVRLAKSICCKRCASNGHSIGIWIHLGFQFVHSYMSGSQIRDR